MIKMRHSNYSKIFSALSDPERFDIFNNLLKESKVCEIEGDEFVYRGNCVSNLGKRTSLSQPTISHHLKVLEKAGLIYRKRKGKWIHFFVEKSVLKEIGEFLYSCTASDSSEDNNQIQIDIPETIHFDQEKLLELIALLEDYGLLQIQLHEGDDFTKIFLSKDLDRNGVFIITYYFNKPYLDLRGVNSSAGEDINEAKEIMSLIEKFLPSLK